MARWPVTELKTISYGAYVYAPVAAFLVWIANLIALLVLWQVRDNGGKYQGDEPDIVYISDVGAAHKTLFIIMNALTWFFFTVTMLFERWLRHVDRIPGTVRSRERSCDVAALIFAFLGGAALTFLAIFDAFNHNRVHWSLTVVFIVCISISAVCQTSEVYFLHNDHPDRRHLLRNACFKLIIVTFAILGAIAFAVCYAICRGSNGVEGRGGQCNAILSAAAVLEWAIAFGFGLYLATLILDLFPAAKTSPRHLRRLERRREKERGLLRPGTDSPGDNASVGYPVRPSNDMRQV